MSIFSQHAALLKKTSFIPPPSNNANMLLLDGINQRGDIPADVATQFGDGDQSFTGIVDFSANNGNIFMAGTAAGAAYVDFNFDGNSKLQLRAFNNASGFSNQRRGIIDSALSLGKYFIAVVFNGWGTFDFYVDGSIVPSSMPATGTIDTHTNTGNISIGAIKDNTLFLNGSIAIPIFYDKNLSAAEISAIYNTGNGIQPGDYQTHPNSVISGLYNNITVGIPFNNGEASPENDGGPNGINASLINSPTYTGTVQSFEDPLAASILLPCDGTNGSTSFPDSSIIEPNTFTVEGSAIVSTAAPKFGTGSLNMTGNGGLDCSSPTFDIGTSDFTLDFWIFLTNATNQGIAQFTAGSNANCWTIGTGNSDKQMAFEQRLGGGGDAFMKDSGNFPESAWTHFAVTRSGNDFFMFVAGIQVGTISSANGLPTLTQIKIGRLPIYSDFTTGDFDEFRFVLGTAVWTSNFTPPSVPYTL